VSQLGALAWAFLVLGPHLELVTLAPAGIWLARRLGGTALAACAAGGVMVLALGCTWAGYMGLASPVLPLAAFVASVLATVVAALGLGLALWAVQSSVAAREKSEMALLARRDEAQVLRKQVSLDRVWLEREAEVLGDALVAALRGTSAKQVRVDGALGPVAEISNAVAERLRTLQQDREDRIRLEGALRLVTSAVERGWLGLPWRWPAASGTALDDLVALLRTPRPHERVTGTSDDFPTLVPLTTLASSGGYWRRPQLPGEHSMSSYPGGSSPTMSQGRIGWDDLLGAR
jgi:hypothetical protein